MEYIALGNTGLHISRIGFGCEPLGGYDWGAVDEREVLRAVQCALDLGINCFDTADVYGLGRSEENLSQALGSRRHDVIIATKFGVSWTQGSRRGRAVTSYDSSPRRIVQALEGSLRRLRVECIPLYQINWPDPKTPISDTMEALGRCQEAGKIGHIGCCNFPASWISEAHRSRPLASAQAQYNLFERTLEDEILPCCQELGIGVLVWGPLAQGLLTGKFKPGARFGASDRRSRLAKFQGDTFLHNLNVVEKLKNLGRKYGRTPAQVALRWVLDNTSISCAITGATCPSQVQENIGALGWNLSQEERSGLTQEAQLERLW